MAFVYLAPLHRVQPGDFLRRPKKSGWGYHFGTGVSGGLIEHTLPNIGKHLTTLEGFADGEIVEVFRPDRTPYEKALIEQRAMQNLGGSYDYQNDNCEHDSSYAQTGVAQSPTVGALTVAGIAGLIFIGCKIVDSSRWD